MKISVITICYNSAALIERTMASVLGQSHPDLEYVIVDGGSSDGTVEIVRRFAAKDPRVKWVSEPDQGISDAMNKGVRMASGDIVAHLHSDEYYLHPEVLSEVAALFKENPDRGWLTGGFHFVDRKGRLLREVRVRRYSYRRLIHSNVILHSATFIRRSAFLAAGGFEQSLRYCMDYHLWLRLGAMGDPLTVDRPFTCFTVHHGSRSTVESGATYAEELQVRLAFLKERGKWQFPYRVEYFIRQRLNRLYMKRLFSASGDPVGGES
ncbi:MAG TPA: glycosyltransferase [Geobacter sp.]|nr:glycosyltransferase [Geobacter sp.]